MSLRNKILLFHDFGATKKTNVASRCDPFGKSQLFIALCRRLKATVIAVAFRQRI